ncbi:DedA family protein [Flaviflagellibacter deserti]|jgi:membrane protein DedA with SNARE-associated domain|uniref:DedA family protein n=1 Tax=Flaviflagellibacter deserti TaxID=2267266 RepID=A0ABV9YX52_9HYPH
MDALAGMPDLVALLAGFGAFGFVLCALVERIVPVLPFYLMLVVLGMTSIASGHDLAIAAIACTMGSTLGSLGWYLIGRWLGAERGEALVARFGRYVFFDLHQYRRLTASYMRDRFWITVVGQTIPAVRIYLAFPAGVLGLPPVGFAAATFLGALAWNTPLLALGYVLRGSAIDPVTAAIGTIAGLLALEFGLVAFLRIGRLFRRNRVAPAERRT